MGSLSVLAAVPTGPTKQPALTPADPDWSLHEVVSEVDKKDEGTPDSWVPRHPDLVRLTGRHPFNCEPTLKDLMKHGFVTPASLHYVRNHGAAPRIQWSKHRVTVKGLVGKPRKFTMDEIAALPSVTIPVTLVCAGNRRKEENMVKKTIGFNWGPAGTSTGYWTGVRLSDLLTLCGAKGPAQGGRHVAFRGPKKELPQGEDGSYGTSLKWEYAMDPANDVLIAYKHNGRYLTPDHGFPVRMIIPGFIGGRMVKFLEEIVVQGEESDNHYHFMDNRVLPPHVDAEKAKAEGWWFKPEYIINQLNINSVISSPAHDEVVPTAQPDTPYTMKGYCYTGGGRKIIRMEVSFDRGATWELANLHQIEKPTEYGRYWCWIFWDLEVPVSRIAGAAELWCRGWDEAQNTQPEKLTWNLMGMMNNSIFKVKVHPAAGGGITFEQPTQPGALPGGYMVPGEGGAPAAAPAAAPGAAASNGKTFTMEEVEKHDSEESTWFVINGRVYDSTRYNKDHPGGVSSIVLAAGEDATEEFMSIHSQKAKKLLEDYYIGDLAGGTGAAPVGAAPASAAAAVPGQPLMTLNPKKRMALPLIEKIEVSHNTRIFRFGLPSKEHKLGLPVGQHFFIYAKDKKTEETIIRAYTPMTSDNVAGHVDLLIKVYWANEHPRFPEGGKMSQHLESLAIGETIEVKGPIGHFTYKGQGKYEDGQRAGQVKNLTMLCGGTGITPMWQVLSEILAHPEDTTQIKLLFANQTEDDILLRKELDALAAKHDNLSVWYTLDKAPEGWKYSQGFISEEMLRAQVHPAGTADDTLCLMCGPPPMLNFACIPNLKKMGYTDEQLVTF
mmetsp:Transcript_30238/g.78184  ORF Transcript_30238/g.78184 Transcript_30238/m.78184 type:complete len:834 (-) Transcript_30238:53-2554(-)